MNISHQKWAKILALGIFSMLLTFLLFRYVSDSSAHPTQVIRYVPAVPSTFKEGYCWTTSLASPGTPFAWRCALGNNIHDPCLTATDGKTLVCGVPNHEVGVKLTEPLAQAEVGNQQTPWLLELSGGVKCSRFTGTLPPIDETAPYGCDDESVIVGDLVQGEIWRARKALIERDPTQGPDAGFYRIAKEDVVPITKVWLTGEPKAGKP